MRRQQDQARARRHAVRQVWWFARHTGGHGAARYGACAACGRVGPLAVVGAEWPQADRASRCRRCLLRGRVPA